MAEETSKTKVTPDIMQTILLDDVARGIRDIKKNFGLNRVSSLANTDSSREDTEVPHDVTKFQVELWPLIEQSQLGAISKVLTYGITTVTAGLSKREEIEPSLNKAYKIKRIVFGDSCLYNFWITFKIDTLIVMARQRILTTNIEVEFTTPMIATSLIDIYFENFSATVSNDYEVSIYVTEYDTVSVNRFLRELGLKRLEL